MTEKAVNPRRFPSILVEHDLPHDFPIEAKLLPASGTQPLRQLHYHNCFEITHCVDGHGFFVIDDRIEPFDAGDLFFLADFSPHFPRAAHGSSSVWETLFLNPSGLVVSTHEDYRLLDTQSVASFRSNAMDFPDHHDALLRLFDLTAAALKERPDYYRSEVRGLVTALVVRLQRFARRTDSRSAASERRRYALDRILPVVQYIAINYHESIDLGKLGERHGFSRSALQSLFRQALGKPPSEFLREIRMTVALRLLQTTGKPIIEIASEVGYPTISNFNRCFRAVYGASPREMRAEG